MLYRRLLLVSICFFIKNCSCLPQPAFSPHGSSSQMNAIESMNVKCGRSGMSVTLSFSRPFTGVVYSKGYYNNKNCNYFPAQGSSAYETSFTFWIPSDDCGSKGNFNEATSKEEMYFTNTIIIQNDPIIQEVWDTARILKCSWRQKTMKKSLETKPILVQGPQIVPITFTSQSLNTLSNIESSSRSSPFSDPINGYVSSTDNDRSLVIYIQDSTHSFDANVVSCYSKTSRGGRTNLIDAHGCAVRPELLGEFDTVKSPNNIEADLQMFSYLKGLDLENDPDFSVSCEIEVCEGSCLPPCALGPVQDSYLRRQKRQATGSFSELPEGIIVFASQKNNKDSNVCYIGDLVAITTSSLFVIVVILGGLCAYLGFKLNALSPKHKIPS